ncbi:MAG: T9SS type A sorting domain-containing protein [Cyclobacteriaceae bacterium]|nr:T9SS type A sorting domain-containing protein [Cyclobacteriaceae bacterium]
MSRTILLFLLLFLAASSAGLFAQNNTVDLYIPGKIAKPAEEVSVELKVNGFENIIAFQASLNWNPELLMYKSISYYGIKFLDEGDFGTSTTNLGHLRFSWDPSDALPLSLPDSTIIFRAVFQVVARQNQDITIGFTDLSSTTPYVNEFANDDYEILPLNTTAGIVKARAHNADLLVISSSADTSCDMLEPLGSLKASVDGDSTHYTFRWYAGNEVKDTPDHEGYRFDGVIAGEYTLQVLDDAKNIFVQSLATSVADQSNYQSDQIELVSTSAQTHCSDLAEKQTGALEININDSQTTGSFSIWWWQGEVAEGVEWTMAKDAFNAEKLPAAQYSVMVENKSSGCKSYLVANVPYQPVTLQLAVETTPNNYCKDGKNGSATVVEPVLPHVRYYWFAGNEALDISKSLFSGRTYSGIADGLYTAWVIDTLSECHAQQTVNVAKEEIYEEAQVRLEGATLLSDDDRANWFKDDIYLQQTGASLVPEESGYYTITVRNEYNCLSKSEAVYFGITGLDDLKNQGLSLYPNPFAREFSISHSGENLDFIHIFDAQGRLIHENNAINKQFINVRLSSSSNGFYFIKIGSKGKIYQRKIKQELSK